MRKPGLIRLFGMSAALLAASHGPAYAYVDPGTGSLLLQMLIGGVVGGLVVIKVYYARFRDFLARRLRTDRKKAGK